MPAPVQFSLSLAPFPVNYSATPQVFAQDLINRLTITPSAPWSSFQYGGSLPTSDIGPVLFNANGAYEWKVWNVGSGTYVDLVVQGDGIVNNSIPLSAMGTQTPGGIFTYDASGKPTTLAPSTAPTGPNWVSGTTYVPGNYVTYLGVVYICILGVSGSTAPNSDTTHWTAQSAVTTGAVLTQSSAGLPVWLALPASSGASSFELTNSGIQIFTSSPSGTTTTMQFNTTKFMTGTSYNAGAFSVNIGANQSWYFYVQVQFDYAGTPPTWQASVNIVSSGGQSIGGLINAVTPLPRQGMFVGGVMSPSAGATTVLAQAVMVETPGSTNLSMQLNSANQRFGGFRLS